MYTRTPQYTFLEAPDAKSQFTGKDHDARKDEGKWKRGQQRMRWLDRWHHQLNGHESEQTPGDSEGQGSMGSCSPCGCKESDTTYQQHGGKGHISSQPRDQTQVSCIASGLFTS